MAKVTKKPTGLTVSRDGTKFTFSWKIADKNYDAGVNIAASNRKKQIYKGKLVDGPKVTKKTFNYNLNTSFSGVSWSVQGRRKNDSEGTYTMSPWAYKTWDIYPPAFPSVACSVSSEAENSSTFSWSIADNKTWMSIFTKYEWQSVLVLNHKSNNPPSKWDGLAKHSSSGTSTSGSWTKNEDYVPTTSNSYTRWFRVRSVGPAGTRGWRYAKHVYALPAMPYKVSAKLSKKASSVGYMCTAYWTADPNYIRPIDLVTAEYVVATPATQSTVTAGTKKVTWSCPEVSGWTEAASLKDTAGQDATMFQIDQNLDDDEAVFVRIKTQHDSHILTSPEVMATGGIGSLPLATGISITPNADTHRASITASNGSSITDSFIAVYYRTSADPSDVKCIGILPHGTASITVQCPDWGEDTPSFGLRTLLADYSPATPISGGVTEYTISNIKMKSNNIQWADSVVPKEPTLQATPVDPSTIRVNWDWPWDEANQTEISWADHEDAWTSTSQPSSYIVDNLNAAEWNISGLSVGTWYVRVRLLKTVGDNTSYGLWSETKTVKLSSAPAIPSLMVDNQTVAPDGEVVCYWAYVSTDGTAQMAANICEATFDSVSGTYTYGTPFAKADTAQHLSFMVADQGWASGETHYLAVRVVSASGEQSQDWSTPIPVKVADPIECHITSTNLVEKTMYEDEYALTADTEIDSNKTYYERSGDEGSYIYTEVLNPIEEDLPNYYESLETTILSLTELPLTISVSGAGVGSTTTVILERSKSYHMDRPDESDADGFEGETIFMNEYENDGSFSIQQEDLLGYLDDGAEYRLLAIAKDSYGQTAQDEAIFEVHWDHQAVVPTGTVQIDTDHDVAILTPLLPDGITAMAGDVCDIYRLSIDKPELIYRGASFGSQYVDPYPTIGKHGGYRFVYRTFNGDYTTDDGLIAWYNTTDDDNHEILDTFAMIINYDGVERLRLIYNMSLNNKWAKDFQKTSYLGGHIQGDWNPAVERTGSVSSVGVVADEYGSEEDHALIESIRRLAIYPGICHVRTPDGSSYAANVDVTEDREEKMINQLAQYTLTITKVDTESTDGMTYAEWLDQINEG